MIAASSVVPASLIVPPLSAIALVPIDKISPAFVAALAAPITNVNINSLVPVPLAYDNVWFALWSLVTVNCGVPVTSTASLNLAVTDNVVYL